MFTKASQPKITLSSTNDQVLAVIRAEAKEAIKRTYNVLSKRIDKFGVSQPSINLDENKGIITVELAGVKNPESVRKYLQATAKLQFWEVATNQEMAPYLMKANTVLKNYLKGGKAEEAVKDTAVVAKADTAAKTDTAKVAATAETKDTGSLNSLLAKEDTSKDAAGSPAAIGDKREDDLFTIMQPMVDMQSGQFVDAVIVGAVMKKDANKLLDYLKLDIVKNQFLQYQIPVG